MAVCIDGELLTGLATSRSGAPAWAGNFAATVVDADNCSLEGRGRTLGGTAQHGHRYGALEFKSLMEPGKALLVFGGEDAGDSGQASRRHLSEADSLNSFWILLDLVVPAVASCIFLRNARGIGVPLAQGGAGRHLTSPVRYVSDSRKFYKLWRMQT